MLCYVMCMKCYFCKRHSLTHTHTNTLIHMQSPFFEGKYALSSHGMKPWICFAFGCDEKWMVFYSMIILFPTMHNLHFICFRFRIRIRTSTETEYIIFIKYLLQWLYELCVCVAFLEHHFHNVPSHRRRLDTATPNFI